MKVMHYKSKGDYVVPPDYSRRWQILQSNSTRVSSLKGASTPNMLNNELSAYLLRWYQKLSLIGCSYVPAYEGACMCRSSARSQADW